MHALDQSALAAPQMREQLGFTRHSREGETRRGSPHGKQRPYIISREKIRGAVTSRRCINASRNPVPLSFAFELRIRYREFLIEFYRSRRFRDATRGGCLFRVLRVLYVGQIRQLWAADIRSLERRMEDGRNKSVIHIYIFIHIRVFVDIYIYKYLDIYMYIEDGENRSCPWGQEERAYIHACRSINKMCVLLAINW